MKRILLATTLVPILALPAFAQADDTVRREQTVIVTAPGAERAADELIGNASALDRDEIVDNLASTLGDTLDSEPGVATTFFGQGASRPVLRGLGAERVLVLTNGIGVIDASAASPDHQVTGDGIDAEKIEILRGPAALAYGGQAIGGVVNVIDGLIAEETPDAPISGHGFGAFNTVNDGSELGGHATLGAGPFVLNVTASTRDFENYDIPGFAESAILRASEEEDEDGEEEEVRGTVENSFVETSTLAGGISWVGESAFFGVAVRQQEALYGLPGGHAHEEEEGEDGEEEEEEENPFIDLEQTRIDIRGGISFENSPVTGVSGSIAIADYTHTEFEAPGEPGTLYNSDGVESRLEIDHAIAGFDGAVGIQYTDKTLEAFGEEAFITPTDSETVGAFLYEAREWESGFGIEGGARIENVQYDSIVNGEREFDLLSGSIGLHQHWQNNVFLGGQLSLTERAPNESELFADGPHLATNQFEVGNAAFSEESGFNAEITARYRTDTFGIGINLFQTEFDDFIYLEPGATIEDGALVTEADGLSVFLFTQQDATFKGGEIYGDLIVPAGPLGADWAFEASLDFVDAELDDGGNVPLIPPLTFNSDVSATWSALTLGASLTLAGDHDDTATSEFETEGFTRLDLRAEYALTDLFQGTREGTRLFIEARNVTDEEIRYSTSVLKDVAPAPGRNVRFGISVDF